MTLKNSVAALIILLIVSSLLYIGVSFFSQIACEGQPINNNAAPTNEQQIFGDRLIGQSFTAPRHGLNRLDLFFQTYARRNTHGLTLRLYETSAQDVFSLNGPLKFETSFNAAAVSDQSWHSFTFAPLADSAGKTYLMVLASPDSTDGNAITVGGIERNSYLPGTAFLGPIPVPADITFRSCYQMSAGEKLAVFTGQLTQNRTGPWQNAAFYGFSLLLYLLLLLGFFRFLLKITRTII